MKSTVAYGGLRWQLGALVSMWMWPKPWWLALRCIEPQSAYPSASSHFTPGAWSVVRWDNSFSEHILSSLQEWAVGYPASTSLRRACTAHVICFTKRLCWQFGGFCRCQWCYNVCFSWARADVCKYCSIGVNCICTNVADYWYYASENVKCSSECNITHSDVRPYFSYVLGSCMSQFCNFTREVLSIWSLRIMQSSWFYFR